MLGLFDLVAKRREEIEKAAVIGAAARSMLGVGKTLVKNPLKTLGAAGGGFELHQAFSRGSNLASGAKNVARAKAKFPTRPNTL